MKIIRFFSQLFQYVCIFAMGLLLVFGLLVHFGYTTPIYPFVVLSGSMEPTLPVGSVVLVRQKPFGYSLGDMITFQLPGRKEKVTHRIVSLSLVNQSIRYQTKGDANPKADLDLISPNQVVGQVFVILPYLGKVAHFAKQPYGFIALVVIPATIVVWEELKNLYMEIIRLIKSSLIWFSSMSHTLHGFRIRDFTGNLRKQSITSHQQSGKMAIKQPKSYPKSLALVPVFFVLVALLAYSSLAYFNDHEVSLGNVLGAASQFNP